MADKRFDVNFSLNVTEDKEDGSSAPFFDSSINYHDLPYDGVVAVETILVDALTKLNDMGYVQAERHGADMHQLQALKATIG